MILFLLNIGKVIFELVKELLLQATVYVYEDNQEIQGFIGAERRIYRRAFCF